MYIHTVCICRQNDQYYNSEEWEVLKEPNVFFFQMVLSENNFRIAELEVWICTYFLSILNEMEPLLSKRYFRQFLVSH